MISIGLFIKGNFLDVFKFGCWKFVGFFEELRMLFIFLEFKYFGVCLQIYKQDYGRCLLFVVVIGIFDLYMSM